MDNLSSKKLSNCKLSRGDLGVCLIQANTLSLIKGGNLNFNGIFQKTKLPRICFHSYFLSIQSFPIKLKWLGIYAFSNSPTLTPTSLTFFFSSNLLRHSKAAVLISFTAFVGFIRVFALVWVSKSLNLTFTVTVLPV